MQDQEIRRLSAIVTKYEKGLKFDNQKWEQEVRESGQSSISLIQVE